MRSLLSNHQTVIMSLVLDMGRLFMFYFVLTTKIIATNYCYDPFLIACYYSTEKCVFLFVVQNKHIALFKKNILVQFMWCQFIKHFVFRISFTHMKIVLKHSPSLVICWTVVHRLASINTFIFSSSMS